MNLSKLTIYLIQLLKTILSKLDQETYHSETDLELKEEPVQEEEIEEEEIEEEDEPVVVKEVRTFKIDWGFIQTLEGFETRGYVPVEENERDNKVKSGVTIGSGFDLGQHTSTYVKTMQFSPEIEKRLLRYVGLKGEDARQALRDMPLILSVEEATEINKKVKNDKAVEAAMLYNRDSDLDFYDLDSAPQTVIMSVAFQYGDPSRRTPNFWKGVTRGDWDKTIWNLEHFGDIYKTRRKKEAKLLRSYVKNLNRGVS